MTSQFSYFQQFIVIALITMCIGSLVLKRSIKGIENWKHFLTHDIKEIRDIRARCFTLPYLIYVSQIVFPLIIIFIVLNFVVFISNSSLYALIYKIIIVLLSFFSLAAFFLFIFSKNFFRNILIKTYRGESPEGFRINLKLKIFIQVLPIVTGAILFTSLIGYSILIKEKSNLLFNITSVA